jgi:hypothetical protein
MRQITEEQTRLSDASLDLVSLVVRGPAAAGFAIKYHQE